MEPNSDISQPQPTLAPTPPISPVYPISQSKNHTVVWIAAGAIILTIGIGIGLTLGKYSPKPKQITSYEECVKAKGSYIQESNPPTCVTSKGLSFKDVTSPVTQSSESEISPFSDLTANWKTYINSENNLSFQYPSDWVLHKPEDGNGANPCCSLWLTVSQDRILNVRIFENDFSVTNKLALVYPNKPETISINGLQGVHFKNDSGGEYILNVKGKALELSYVIINNIDYGIETNQILSTFKFIDNTNEGTLEATVMRSPTCAGAQRPGEICEAPVANETFDIFLVVSTKNNEGKSKQEIFYGTDGLVKKQTVSTNAVGQFTMTLETGSYQIRNTLTGIGNNINNRDFTILAGKTTTQQFNIDTGIR